MLIQGIESLEPEAREAVKPNQGEKENKVIQKDGQMPGMRFAHIGKTGRKCGI